MAGLAPCPLPLGFPAPSPSTRGHNGINKTRLARPTSTYIPQLTRREISGYTTDLSRQITASNPVIILKTLIETDLKLGKHKEMSCNNQLLHRQTTGFTLNIKQILEPTIYMVSFRLFMSNNIGCSRAPAEVPTDQHMRSTIRKNTS